VKVFNKAYNIKITESELHEVQKEALKNVLDRGTIPADDSLVDQQKYAKMKYKVIALSDKHSQDMLILDQKSANVLKHVKSHEVELLELQGMLIYIVFSNF
jgi:hypothetical protein